MKTRLAWVPLSLGIALAAAPGFAQATDVGRENLHHGKITVIDHAAKSFTIETRTGPEQFTLWQGAQVTGADERKSFDALAVGETVAVRSIQDENQRWLARSVQVVDSNELAGQLEAYPAVDVADTVTVRSLDTVAGELHVATADGPRVYQVSEESRVVRGGNDAAIGSLRADERVVVSAEETAPGRYLAKVVTVVSQGPAPVDQPAVSAGPGQ